MFIFYLAFLYAFYVFRKQLYNVLPMKLKILIGGAILFSKIGFSYIKTIVTQKYFNNVIQVTDDTYKISYVIDNKLYHLMTKKKQNPIICILDENINNVTDAILPYMGVGYDGNSNGFTPSLLNYKKLTFITECGDEISFNENQTVSIK